jgi:hypothetical protein
MKLYLPGVIPFIDSLFGVLRLLVTFPFPITWNPIRTRKIPPSQTLEQGTANTRPETNVSSTVVPPRVIELSILSIPVLQPKLGF